MAKARRQKPQEALAIDFLRGDEFYLSSIINAEKLEQELFTLNPPKTIKFLDTHLNFFPGYAVENKNMEEHSYRARGDRHYPISLMFTPAGCEELKRRVKKRVRDLPQSPAEKDIFGSVDDMRKALQRQARDPKYAAHPARRHLQSVYDMTLKEAELLFPGNKEGTEKIVKLTRIRNLTELLGTMYTRAGLEHFIDYHIPKNDKAEQVKVRTGQEFIDEDLPISRYLEECVYGASEFNNMQVRFNAFVSKDFRRIIADRHWPVALLKNPPASFFAQTSLWLPFYPRDYQAKVHLDNGILLGGRLLDGLIDRDLAIRQRYRRAFDHTILFPVYLGVGDKLESYFSEEVTGNSYTYLMKEFKQTINQFSDVPGSGQHGPSYDKIDVKPWHILAEMHFLLENDEYKRTGYANRVRRAMPECAHFYDRFMHRVKRMAKSTDYKPLTAEKSVPVIDLREWTEDKTKNARINEELVKTLRADMENFIQTQIGSGYNYVEYDRDYASEDQVRIRITMRNRDGQSVSQGFKTHTPNLRLVDQCIEQVVLPLLHECMGMYPNLIAGRPDSRGQTIEQQGRRFSGYGQLPAGRITRMPKEPELDGSNYVCRVGFQVEEEGKIRHVSVLIPLGLTTHMVEEAHKGKEREFRAEDGVIEARKRLSYVVKYLNGRKMQGDIRRSELIDALRKAVIGKVDGLDSSRYGWRLVERLPYRDNAIQDVPLEFPSADVRGQSTVLKSVAIVTSDAHINPTYVAELVFSVPAMGEAFKFIPIRVNLHTMDAEVASQNLDLLLGDQAAQPNLASWEKMRHGEGVGLFEQMKLLAQLHGKNGIPAISREPLRWHIDSKDKLLFEQEKGRKDRGTNLPDRTKVLKISDGSIASAVVRDRQYPQTLEEVVAELPKFTRAYQLHFEELSIRDGRQTIRVSIRRSDDMLDTPFYLSRKKPREGGRKTALDAYPIPFSHEFSLPIVNGEVEGGRPKLEAFKRKMQDEFRDRLSKRYQAKEVSPAADEGGDAVTIRRTGRRIKPQGIASTYKLIYNQEIKATYPDLEPMTENLAAQEEEEANIAYRSGSDDKSGIA